MSSQPASIRDWLQNSHLFEIRRELFSGCPLLRAFRREDAFDWEIDGTKEEWQGLKKNLQSHQFDGINLLETRAALIGCFQPSASVDETYLTKILDAFVTTIEAAWSVDSQTLPDPPLANRRPFFLDAIERSGASRIAKVLEQYASGKTTTGREMLMHPGFLMAGDLLAKLCKVDFQPQLVVKTKVLFALDHPDDPMGLFGDLTIERMANGCGLLIPDAEYCGYLRTSKSFSRGFQNAWLAARQHLRNVENEWRPHQENCNGLLKYDWRWRLDLTGARETISARFNSAWNDAFIPLSGRSGETAIACALIAAAENNPDNEGGVDPLDRNIACTATIDVTQAHLPLGYVTAVKTKTISGEIITDDGTITDEGTIIKERLHEIVVSTKQPEGTLPTNDAKYQIVPCSRLAAAYEHMVRFPRITRGVNRFIAAETQADLQKLCTPHIQPDVADSLTWAEAVRQEPDKYGIWPPDDALLAPESLEQLILGNLEYRPVGASTGPPPEAQPGRCRLRGNRIFLEGDSGLGKSIFLIRSQHEIATRCASRLLPIRLGKSLPNAAALSEFPWDRLSSEVLLQHSSLHTYVSAYNQSLAARGAKLSDQQILDWVEWMLRRGRLVLLFDALDQTHREGIIALGASLARQHWCQCPVVMTGRPEAKLDRTEAQLANEWHVLSLVPFDKQRWNRYLGTTRIEDTIDEAILSVPLLLRMVKSLRDKGGNLESLTRTELYDRAMEQLMDRGLEIINNQHHNLRNFATNRLVVRQRLGEIAWTMHTETGFVNSLTGEAFERLEARLQPVDGISALDAIDITTAEKLIASNGSRSGLSFRHRSFLEYFLASFLARTFQPKNVPTIGKPLPAILPTVAEPLTEEEFVRLLDRIHCVDENAGGTSQDWTPEAWKNTFRFLLSMVPQIPPTESIPGSHASELQGRDRLAKLLMERGNPWIVYDAINKDKVTYSPEIESTCRWLVHRDSSYYSAVAKRDAKEISTQAKSFLASSQLDSNAMLDRRYRDAAYLWPLRELVGDRHVHAYSNESTLVEKLTKLPSGAGPWNFLESFYQIDGGVFEYGVKPEEVAEKRVKVDSFQMADFPVTNACYELFCPSKRRERDEYSSRDDDPVLYVSWYMAMEFCQWLSAITRNEYRLPTDYEWEWAVRGHKVNQRYWWGNDVKQGLLWCRETQNAGRTRSRSEAIDAHNNAGVYHPTKQQKREGYGLMDLHGNGWEWTINNELGKSYNSTHTGGSPRFLVGGSWDCDAVDTRCGGRYVSSPDNRDYFIGFRIVLR